MHQNLLSTFSVNQQRNLLSKMDGFQLLRGDLAYNTFFCVYAKMTGKYNEQFQSFTPDGITLYLQNYFGMVTIGFAQEDIEVDLVFDDHSMQPVYYLKLLCKALNYNPFIPKDNINHVNRDETLNRDLGVAQVKFKKDFTINKLKKDRDAIPLPLAKNNVLEEAIEKYQSILEEDKKNAFFKDSFLMKYKLYIDLDYENINPKTDDLSTSPFVDPSYYERFGEEFFYKNGVNVKKEDIIDRTPKHILGAIVNSEVGRIIDNVKCKPNYVVLVE